MIDPGPREISGKDQKGVHFSRDTIPPGYKGGNFPPETLKPFRIDTLGELRTDSEGRLLFLGGLGHSGSSIDPPHIDQYANNDGWYDDTSDGSIEAVITVKDEQGNTHEIVAEPGWVLCGPPSYAPQIANVVTLYDTIFDAAVRYQGAHPEIFKDELWNGGPDGYKPYFETDIKPIFEYASNYAWVTAIPPKPHTFDYSKINRPDPSLTGMRQYYLDFIRAPGQENVLINAQRGNTLMPYLAGDDALSASAPGTVTAATSKYLRVTDTQYFFLTQWAAGYFHEGAAPQGHAGHALTRAVLENCVGGAFSPGIEMTWISRNPDIYSAPFRIKKRTPPTDPLSLGYDPQAGMEPGDITRYMAVPWQADFNECSSQPIVGRILWWWPAQRPEFVYLKPDDTAPKGPRLELGPQMPWIGTASPGVPALLSRLGLDPKLEHLGHLPYYGNLSVWGDAEPAVDDFLRRGLPHGYHLDREAFDRWLREEAIDAGAMLCTPVEHIQVERVEGRFTVRCQYRGNVVELRAALLVDATGRSAFLARQMGAGIHRSDRLVALALLAEAAEDSRLRGLSMVEAFEDGWIYAAGLPGGQCMITVMSDDDIAREGHYREPSVFRALIQNTRHIGPALRLPEDIQVVTAAAASQYSDRAVGAGWIAVGDALIAFDPLTSSGIAGALDDGLSAAATILAWYSSENSAEALAACGGLEFVGEWAGVGKV